MIENILNKSTVSGRLQEIGIGGFTAYVAIEKGKQRRATAPVNYLEDGSNASDHIIINPNVINISGVVSDLYIKQTNFNNILTQANATLGLIPIYANGLTEYQQNVANDLINNVANRVSYINSSVALGNQVLNYFGNKDTSNGGIKQQFIDSMNALFDGKQLIDIDLGYEICKSMYISEFTTSQNNQTDDIRFKITAMEVRTAETIYIDAQTYFKAPAKSVASQVADKANKGVQEGEKVQSALSSGTGKLFGWFL
jgi:hypothetical protein